MGDLRKVPGCHVYGGTAPLAAGVAKIPKERTLIFNVDAETEEALKDAPSFKVPFDKERPLPLECFDTIVKAPAEEDDKTQSEQVKLKKMLHNPMMAQFLYLQ